MDISDSIMEKDDVVFCPYIIGDIPPIYLDKDQIVIGEEISKRLSERDLSWMAEYSMEVKKDNSSTEE